MTPADAAEWSQEHGDPGPQDEYGGWVEDPFEGTNINRISAARETMHRARMALYAEQVTVAERAAIARELVGQIDGLADVAIADPDLWREWVAALGVVGGFGGHHRVITRAVGDAVTAAKDRERASKKRATGGGLRDRLSLTAGGAVKPTYGNIVTILRGDPRYQSLRMSTLGGVVEHEGKELEEGPATADLCEWLRDAYGLDAGEVGAKSAIYAVAQGRAYSPVRDYLESVRGKHGDGSIVGRLMAEGLGIADATPMHVTMLGRFLIGAVARAMRPGCKLDTALVLVGEQGAKKSSFFAAMFGRHFGDSPIPIGSKDAPIMMSRVWGYEAAELEDLTSKRSAESVKQFLGSSHDLFRPPFMRAAVNVPRHTALCGSVNPGGGKGGSAAFLSDPSGSRRFWILSIPPTWVVPMGAVRSMRDEAWAWALAEYEAGERWWFDRDEDHARENDAQQYHVEDVWQESVAEWLTEGSALLGNFTTRSVLIGLKMDVKDHTNKDLSRVKAILVRLGWVEKPSPTGFRGKRVWQKAEPATGDQQAINR